MIRGACQCIGVCWRRFNDNRIHESTWIQLRQAVKFQQNHFTIINPKIVPKSFFALAPAPSLINNEENLLLDFLPIKFPSNSIDNNILYRFFRCVFYYGSKILSSLQGFSFFPPLSADSSNYKNSDAATKMLFDFIRKHKKLLNISFNVRHFLPPSAVIGGG